MKCVVWKDIELLYSGNVPRNISWKKQWSSIKVYYMLWICIVRFMLQAFNMCLWFWYLVMKARHFCRLFEFDFPWTLSSENQCRELWIGINFDLIVFIGFSFSTQPKSHLAAWRQGNGAVFCWVHRCKVCYYCHGSPPRLDHLPAYITNNPVMFNNIHALGECHVCF